MSRACVDSPSDILDFLRKFPVEISLKEKDFNVILQQHLSHVTRKPAFCIYENKATYMLLGNREADQGLCFRYTDSTMPLLP